MMAKAPKNSTFRDLLRHPNKRYDETNHALAKMLRDMLAVSGIGPGEWDKLIERYYRKMYTNRKGHIDMIKVNQEKSNLTRALAKDKVPYYRLDTAIQILGCAYYVFTIERYDSRGVMTATRLNVNNRYVHMPDINDVLKDTIPSVTSSDDGDDGDE
jgi:hypothetical protein